MKRVCQTDGPQAGYGLKISPSVGVSVSGVCRKPPTRPIRFYPDSRIARMKDATTHLAYKAKQAVEMKTEMILSARVCKANAGDTQKLETTVIMAQAWLQESGSKRRSWRLRPTRGIIRPETLETFADY